MVMESSEMSVRYNVAAAAACWIMLAGFFILPGTFTALQRSTIINSTQSDVRQFENAVQNISLLPLAGVCYLAAASTMVYLGYRFRLNYIWISRQLLM